MQETLRHLRGLQAFDETARRSSLTRAAQALNVTHGAVSRQIKLLEQYLGVTLFHRLPNGVALTEAGERLYRSTRSGFSSLQTGVSDVRRSQRQQSITVSLSTSLALKWLVPLLTSFQRQHPGITILLDTNDALADFDLSDVDVALRFGKPGWAGLFHEQIRQEQLIVVAAPALVAASVVPMPAEDVVKLPLLHDAFNTGWEHWAAQAGLSADRVAAQTMQFVDSAVLLEAAIDGQGVALARQLLAEHDLERGRLVRLDDRSVPLDRGLYYVCRHGDQERATVRLFKDWLMAMPQLPEAN